MAEQNNILALTFLQSRPEKAAGILEHLDFQEVAEFLHGIPPKIAGPVMGFMLPQYAARLLPFLDKDVSASCLSEMKGQKAAAILRYSDKSLRKALITKLPVKTASLLGLFLGYTEDMIGARMIPEIMLLPDDCCVGEALDRLRRTDQRTHGGIVYVIDRDAQLRGSLHVSALLRESADVPVVAIMEEEGAAVAARATLSSIENNKAWETRNTLPVLNSKKQLVGVLRHTDLHQGLKQVSSKTQEPKGNNAAIGILDIYGTVLLALFDAASGFRNSGKVKQ